MEDGGLSTTASSQPQSNTQYPSPVIPPTQTSNTTNYRVSKPNYILQSDGNSKTWPLDISNTPPAVREKWLDKLSILDFPSGYEMFTFSRDGRPEVHCLYGHPTGKSFKSSSEFRPHLTHLIALSTKPLDTCMCGLCRSLSSSGYPGRRTLRLAPTGQTIFTRGELERASELQPTPWAASIWAKQNTHRIGEVVWVPVNLIPYVREWRDPDYARFLENSVKENFGCVRVGEDGLLKFGCVSERIGLPPRSRGFAKKASMEDLEGITMWPCVVVDVIREGTTGDEDDIGEAFAILGDIVQDYSSCSESEWEGPVQSPKKRPWDSESSRGEYTDGEGKKQKIQSGDSFAELKEEELSRNLEDAAAWSGYDDMTSVKSGADDEDEDLMNIELKKNHTENDTANQGGLDNEPWGGGKLESNEKANELDATNSKKYDFRDRTRLKRSKKELTVQEILYGVKEIPNFSNGKTVGKGRDVSLQNLDADISPQLPKSAPAYIKRPSASSSLSPSSVVISSEMESSPSPSLPSPLTPPYPAPTEQYKVRPLPFSLGSDPEAATIPGAYVEPFSDLKFHLGSNPEHIVWARAAIEAIWGSSYWGGDEYLVSTDESEQSTREQVGKRKVTKIEMKRLRFGVEEIRVGDLIGLSKQPGVISLESVDPIKVMLLPTRVDWHTATRHPLLRITRIIRETTFLQTIDINTKPRIKHDSTYSAEDLKTLEDDELSLYMQDEDDDQMYLRFMKEFYTRHPGSDLEKCAQRGDGCIRERVIIEGSVVLFVEEESSNSKDWLLDTGKVLTVDLNDIRGRVRRSWARKAGKGGLRIRNIAKDADDFEKNSVMKKGDFAWQKQWMAVGGEDCLGMPIGKLKVSWIDPPPRPAPWPKSVASRSKIHRIDGITDFTSTRPSLLSKSSMPLGASLSSTQGAGSLAAALSSRTIFPQQIARIPAISPNNTNGRVTNPSTVSSQQHSHSPLLRDSNTGLIFPNGDPAPFTEVHFLTGSDGDGDDEDFESGKDKDSRFSRKGRNRSRRSSVSFGDDESEEHRNASPMQVLETKKVRARHKKPEEVPEVICLD